MVTITAKRNDLLNPLSSVAGIIERRHTLPILSNVVLEARDDNLFFLGTDIEIQITSRATGVPGLGFKPLTVGARKLLDILRALPEDADVRLQPHEKRLQVIAGKSRFALQTLPAEDFPKLGKPAGDTARFTVRQGTLRKLIALVQYAMAQQDIRYYLNGLLFVVEDQLLKAVATDGHRLAYAAVPLPGDLARQEVIVPRKTITELSRLLTDNDDDVHVVLSPTQATFTFGALELVSKLIDGKFPDYARVIPAQDRNRMVVAGETLRQALSRVAILSNEKFRGVRWVLSSGKLRIVSSNAEQEEAQEEIDVNYAGIDLDVGFNVNYLLDVLNNVSGKEVECSFADAASSVLMRFPEEQEFKYVVMPMRI